MKDIKSLLYIVDREEKTIEKIAKFLKTKVGQRFVTELDRMTVKELCLKYKAPKFLMLYNNEKKNKNIIQAAIKKFNITIPAYRPTIIGPCTVKKYKSRLSSKELQEINAKRPSKHMGFAALMHAYEEHKMAKFEKKNPIPTERELAQDLFPEEITSQRATQLYLRREYIRNFLSEAYGHVIFREPFYRVFLVYSNPLGKVYEKEGDPLIIGYPLAGCTQYTDLETIKDRIRNRAKRIRDKDCLEIKVYNKYAKLIACAKT